LRRVKASPIAELAVCCNSYLGLYRHVGNRAQVIELCRVGQQRGLRIHRQLTKVLVQSQRREQ
jgi:hypothetical protein